MRPYNTYIARMAYTKTSLQISAINSEDLPEYLLNIDF